MTAAVLLLFVAFVRAPGTGPLTVNNIQTINGQVFIIQGGFTVLGTSFIPSTANSPGTQGCSWTTGGVCQFATTTSDWILSVLLTLNMVPQAQTTYTTGLTGTPQIAGTSFVGMFMPFSVATTATSGSTMSFLFDLQTTTLPSTTGFVITVR